MHKIMVIDKNRVVSLIYELRVDGSEGEIIESLNEERPLTFIYGNGSLLPKFEDYINGLNVGDAFRFDLKCEDAYGFATEDAVVDIPKSVFEVDGEFDDELVKEGNAIPMMDGDGNRLNGVVVSVEKDTIKMDFNHPLAGDDLHFSGKVVEIREATSEELEHGHIHAASGGGCGSGCGCGSGSNCESDCETNEAGCGCSH
jgi:FKBP-type peptidyl-prolyl cis-trans isomerase SlyD